MFQQQIMVHYIYFLKIFILPLISEGGEIIEWAGFAIATWSLPGLAFAIFTFCNIGPRGYKVFHALNVQSNFILLLKQHHQWYQQKFENYPRSRKAVIPFIW